MSIFNIKNLTVSFKNGKNQNIVLDRLSLNLDSKQLIAITGKSGCGKSTFLNVLYGIEKPKSGIVLFCGNDINKMNEKQYTFYHSSCVSFVFQHYNLLDKLTAMQNVALPLLIRGEKKDVAYKKASELLQKFGLEKIRNNNALNLSGGEKQRIAILRAVITNPKVILCDEPTGALDSKNSCLIMEMFKEISKQIAVILVSHNKVLVEKYADRIIEMKDGKVDKDTSRSNISKYEFSTLKFNKVKSKWINIFVKKNIKMNLRKNIFPFFSLVFGFIVVFLSVGFSKGSNDSINDALKNNYSLELSTISSVEEYEIQNSPLKYERHLRPSLKDIEKNNIFDESIKVEPNLDYVFNPFPYAKINDKEINGFQFVPKYDFSNNRELIFSDENLEDDLKSIVVNNELCSLIGMTPQNILGTEIVVENQCAFSKILDKKGGKIAKDSISYSLKFVVCGVVKEFSFLNSPKIFYSYLRLKEYLNSFPLLNISRESNEYITPLSFVETCDDDNVVSSYCYNLFLTNIQKIDLFENLINELNRNSNLKIISTPLEIRNNYSEFISSFKSSLYVFSVISFLGVSLILGICSLSNFIENKKEAAILICLGAKNSHVKKIYTRINFYEVLMTFFTAILLVYPIQFLINFLVNKNFQISSIISVPFLSFFNVPLLLPFLVLIIALIITSIFVLFPIGFYKHFSLTNELRDE